MQSLREASDPVPLAWVAGNAGPPAYVNVGDALSPVMMSLISGRAVRRAPFACQRTRMVAIGTVGQSIRGGEAAVWGTGCSPWANPLSTGTKRPYELPPGTALRLHATRGPYSAQLLSGGDAPLIPYGDPAMLLPRFYAPKRRPRHALGVVLHLSELADRAFDAHPKPGLARYELNDAGAAGGVRLITMVAPPGSAGIKAKIDELLDCERIVSTSLHGIAIALAYGIPCLYLSAARGTPGILRGALDPAGKGELRGVNARFPDLYAGLGQQRMAWWRQPKDLPTDWAALMDAVDQEGSSEPLIPDALAEICPAGLAPISAMPGGTVWEHPLISGLDQFAAAAA
ncbi:MAG: polysaccharide pyruvyl transferase family protein [Pseudomonadota bacterium]